MAEEEEEPTRADSLRRLQALLSMATAAELEQTAAFLEFSQTLRPGKEVTLLCKGRMVRRDTAKS